MLHVLGILWRSTRIVIETQMVVMEKGHKVDLRGEWSLSPLRLEQEKIIITKNCEKSIWEQIYNWQKGLKATKMTYSEKQWDFLHWRFLRKEYYCLPIMVSCLFSPEAHVLEIPPGPIWEDCMVLMRLCALESLLLERRC